jgi:hypothetical protein
MIVINWNNNLKTTILNMACLDAKPEMRVLSSPDYLLCSLVSFLGCWLHTLGQEQSINPHPEVLWSKKEKEHFLLQSPQIKSHKRTLIIPGLPALALDCLCGTGDGEWGTFSFFHYFLKLLCWGYIVTFTKVLTMYHSWIHPLHHSSLSPLPPFLEWFQ